MISLSNITLQISADAAAWYGAVVATIAAAVSVYNAWSDRARIKVTYQEGMRIMNAVPPYFESKEYFVVHIVNIGRRPVAIGTVAIQYISGENFILSGSINDQNTRILTEEKPKTTIPPTDQSLMDLSKLYCILVYDQAGREYKKYIHKFPTFVKWLWTLRNKK
jgi:hypothetical protein